jgi:splicing factor 1
MKNFFIRAQSEIHHQDINDARTAYEDLYINVSADSYDKVDAAVALIELLLTPVSVSPACLPSLSKSSYLLSTDHGKSFGP